MDQLAGRQPGDGAFGDDVIVDGEFIVICLLQLPEGDATLLVLLLAHEVPSVLLLDLLYTHAPPFHCGDIDGHSPVGTLFLLDPLHEGRLSRQHLFLRLTAALLLRITLPLLLLRLPSDVGQFVLAVPVEAVMVEVALRIILSDLVEVVHVELPHEGGVVAVLEVLRQDLLGEGLLVHDDEADPRGRPSHCRLVLRLLGEREGTLRSQQVFLRKVETARGLRLRGRDQREGCIRGKYYYLQKLSRTTNIQAGWEEKEDTQVWVGSRPIRSRISTWETSLEGDRTHIPYISKRESWITHYIPHISPSLLPIFYRPLLPHAPCIQARPFIILSNKMYTGKSMNFHHDCLDMTESIEYSETDMGAESPIYPRNHLPAFRTFPKIIPNYASEGDLFEAMSIEEDMLAHPGQSNKYKCYRCFGTNRDLSVLNGEATICSQCDGTEYVPASNGLAAILERLLTMKLPHLANRQDEPARRSRERLRNYASQRSIQQQSFSYPDEGTRECSSCLREGDAARMLSCSICPDYFLCNNCHERKRFTHPPSHQLSSCRSDKISVRLIADPRTMKKISEEVQSEETSNCMESLQLEVKCYNCNHSIEECYMACLNCQAEGTQYFLCPECSRDAAYIHDPSHRLDLKAVPQASKIMMSAKPSASQSEITQPTPSKPKSKMKVQGSLVLFDHQFNLDDDEPLPHIVLPSEDYSFNNQSRTGSQEDALRSSNCNSSVATEDLFAKMSVEPEGKEATFGDNQGEDLTHLLVRKKRKKVERMQVSVVNIDMETSIQLPIEKEEHHEKGGQAQEEFQPTVVPYAFSTTNNEVVTQRSFTSNPEQYVFNDYECDICRVSPIRNKRYHCRQCDDFDLCETCFIIRAKRHEHHDYELVDGAELLRKHRDSIMKLEQVKCKLSMSRVGNNRMSHSRTRTELSHRN